MTRHFKIYLLALSLALVSGCSQGGNIDSDQLEETPVRVVLDIALSGRSEPSGVTRAEGGNGISLSYGSDLRNAVTRATIADDPDYQITDLTLLQFGTRGTTLKYEYLDNIQSLSTEVSGDRLVYRPETTLIESPQSTICVIANTGDPTLFVGVNDLNTFRKTVHSFPDEASLLTGGMIPMHGNFTGPVGKDGEITVTLERLLAKLEVDINIALADVTKELELTTAQLISVPVTTTWFDNYKNITVLPSGDEGGYPDVSNAQAGTFFTDYTKVNITDERNITFYTPENIRGNGENTLGGEKLKYAATDPSYGSDPRKDDPYLEEYEAGFSTRLFLSGRYITEDKGDRNILITLYPGEDVVNNFTIKRNALYNIAVNITDINPVQDGGDDNRIYLTEDVTIEKSAPPEFGGPFYEHAFFIYGYGIPGATVTVIFLSGTEETVEVGATGEWMIVTNEYVPGRSYLYAYQTEPGKSPSDWVEAYIRPAV